MTSLDLSRLSRRISELENQNTHGWSGADANELRSSLYDSRLPNDPRRLPSSKALSNVATRLIRKQEVGFTEQDYQRALQRCLHLEGLVNRNRPGSPARLMQDIRQGRIPLGR